jgi:hypothetical protein
MPDNNSYVSLDFFKSRGNLNISGSTDDLKLRRLIESVSRQVDAASRDRHFYSITATRHFSGNGKTRLLFQDWDIVAITSLKEDDNLDGSYNNTFSSSDYFLTPYDADPTGEHNRSQPYTGMEINLKGSGSEDVFLKAQRNYEIVARFGYWEWLDDAGVDHGSSESMTAAATDTTLRTGSTAVVASTKIEVGMTIKLKNEQMYITSRDTSLYGKLTVIRAVNGSTLSAHTSSTDIEVYRYPAPIVEATIEQASRIWTRRGQGFANQIGFQETGQVGPVVTGMDKDVRDLIRPYTRMVT